MGIAHHTGKNLAAGFGCVAGGSLVSLAYHVQGGIALTMLPSGCVLGAAMGIALAAGWVRPSIVAASVGALSALTFFQCLPCDGSNLVMPVLGAVAGWGVWILVSVLRLH